jgi:DNA (cytosine-5)-methyltransferase 1
MATKIKVIDLFCGIGGLTYGFMSENLNVVAGIDIDNSCKYGYEKNSHARFIEKDIDDVTPEDIKKLYGKDIAVRVLVGCAPCQPFSTLNRKRIAYADHSEKWGALHKFAELIEAIKPEIVSMENVKELSKEKKYPVFEKFIKTLHKNGYHVSYQVVDASQYGVPQKRKRLVLLASRFGEIKLINPTHLQRQVTVRDVIQDLPAIEDGEVNAIDMLHTSSKLSALNKRRIQATPHNGGSAKEWEKDLLPDCYTRESGNSYQCTVYGRMRWDEPSPTMTTQFLSLGTGRYGHPEQDRAISLREAARFQTFPDTYVFMEPEKFSKTVVAKHIGNAVPVKLGQAIAISIKQHLQQHLSGN